jgi:hypothetical protein
MLLSGSRVGAHITFSRLIFVSPGHLPLVDLSVHVLLQ